MTFLLCYRKYLLDLIEDWLRDKIDVPVTKANLLNRLTRPFSQFGHLHRNCGIPGTEQT